jgi:uncharacterized membrane protein
MKLIKNKRQWFLITVLVLSFLGFLDASYLSILHFKNAIPPCNITSGCETVLTSKYATIYGIPISLFGSIFYLLLIGLSILNLTDFKKIFAKALVLIVLSGALVSAILIYIQFFILRTLCQYCLFSEGVNFLLVVAAFFFIKKKDFK